MSDHMHGAYGILIANGMQYWTMRHTQQQPANVAIKFMFRLIVFPSNRNINDKTIETTSYGMCACLCV